MMKKKLFATLLCALALCLGLGLTACGETNTPPAGVTLKSESNEAEIDIFEVTYVVIDLPSLFETVPEEASYSVTANSEHLTLSNVSAQGKVNVISDGVVGDYSITVIVSVDGQAVKSFDIAVSVLDSAPAPTVIKELEDISVDAPVFPDTDKTYYEYDLDLSEYFDAASNVTYDVSCADANVTLTADEARPYLVTLILTDFGEQEVRVSAIQNGTAKAYSDFKATLTPAKPHQLINGGFEQGFTGWDLDEWGKAAYSIYDSNVDIWGNGVDNEGCYLYGYYNESGTCEFTSSLFTVGGSGVITWKMAGNCTERLQFVLMQYNEDGDDVEIAKFNNWYFGTYAGSGFIFRNYYYQIPEEYFGSVCYFKVIDEASAEEAGFSFINLDSIVTYYEQAPETTNMYKAGYLVDPDGVSLDMSDTSGEPFPSDLSAVSAQLVNGDFESGYTGWYMTTAEKEAYAIYGSATDIWNNPVNATNNYLYGYAQEGFAAADFHSSLFKVDGSGMITWKMAGNCTEALQFVLMKYNPGGEDEQVAVFNNWYYGAYGESGFIFRNYYYQIDLEAYGGSYMYFVVKDHARGGGVDNDPVTPDFAFISLDDIVTYYEETPEFGEGWYQAGFVTAPTAGTQSA